MNLNADVGEEAGHDDEILPRIDSANVACGVHAGSLTVVVATCRRCAELGVEIGAHPGYDDRESFGRQEVPMSPAQLDALVRFQLGALAAVADVAYVKAHGALYHHCQADAAAAAVLVRAGADFGLAVMGQPGFAILEACRRLGVRGLREGFADRAYLPSGLLAPRSGPGSVLPPAEAAAQALRLARSGDYDSICLHGDSPGAPETALRIREALVEAGIETGPLAASG